MKLDFRSLYLQSEGRVGRTQFWIAAIILASLYVIVKYITGLFTVSLVSFGSAQLVQITSFVFNTFVPIAFLYPVYCLFVKRGHDRGHSPLIMQILTVFIAFVYLAPKAIILLATQESAKSILETMGKGFWVIYMVLAVAAVYALVEYGLRSGTKSANQFGVDPEA